MSTLTYESILATMRELHEKFPPPPSNPLFGGLYRFGGLNLYEAPDPAPMIQVRDIQFDDGMSILPAEFRAKLNVWLLERFGRQDDMFKDSLYLISGVGIIGNKKNIGVIRNLSFAV